MRRDWSAARAKVNGEGCCRVCHSTRRVEAAHIIGREHDKTLAVGYLLAEFQGVVVVRPERIVPLCGPATDTSTCHGRYDAHRLDLLPYLTREEQTQAVADVGLENARIRICGRRTAQATHDAPQTPQEAT